MLVFGLSRSGLRNHTKPLLRHLEPRGLLIWITGNRRHPFALLRVGPVLVWLAHRPALHHKARSGAELFRRGRRGGRASATYQHRSALSVAARSLPGPAAYGLHFPATTLVDQLFNSSEKRLARVLLLMANFGKEGKPEPMIAVSQETLAEMIGTTRSRVSTFMNKFRKLGFINYNGTLEVHNSLLNVVLHDNPHLRRGEG
jgi:hypothetical protein